MIQFEQIKKHILPTFHRIIALQSCQLFLHGDLAKYFITKQTQFIRNNVINLIVTGKFDTLQFYNEVTKHFVINKEFENTSDVYRFLSNGYIFEIKFYEKLPHFKNDFNVNNVFIDLSNQQNVGDIDAIRSLSSSSIFIEKSELPQRWTTDDILGFSIVYASFTRSEIDNSNIQYIKTSNPEKYVRTANTDNALLDLLLSYRPGTGIRFLISNVPNGRQWLFEELINFVCQHNIPLSDDISLNEIFSKTRLDLLDLYNEFFLSERTCAELPKERNNRLLTTLRLMFDSPTLEIQTPYLDNLSLMSETDENAEVSLFEDDGCGYGPCPECNPEECSPACCCCHSTDIVSVSTIRCHKRAVLSCNADATGYGTGPDELFNGCNQCETACQTILGLRPDLEGEGCQNFVNIGSSEGWWTIPSSNWPCDCNCAQEVSGNCALTCVTCRDMFCTSVANVTGNDCNYNISLTPGNDCCGVESVEEIVLVIHATQPTTSNGTPVVYVNVKAVTTEIINRINSVNPNVRYALVTFDDIGTGTDIHGTRYVVNFTNANDLISQIPDTIFQNDESDSPFPSIWHAGIRAATESDWTSSKKRIIFVGGIDNYLINNTPTPPICTGYPQEFGLGECFEAYMAITRENNIHFGCAIQSRSGGESFITTGQFDVIESVFGGFGSCFSAYGFSRTDPDIFFFGSDDFFSCVDASSGFSSSCDCVNSTPIPIRRDLESCKCCRDGITNPCIDNPFDTDCMANLPESCFNIPIIKCLPGQECNCSQPTALNVCGNTILIEPVSQNLVCCSELGFGCQCDDDGGGEPGTNPVECCGPQCHDICTMYRQNSDIEEIIDFVWADCWTKKAGIDTTSTPNCSDNCCPDPSDPDSNDYPCELREPGSNLPCCPCLLENQTDCCNCCIKFLDQNGQPTITYCRSDIAQQVRNIINECTSVPPPPPPWDPPNETCRPDKCIVGEPVITPEKNLDNQCDNKNNGCTTVRHPSAVVLNNGIGLVAYESQENTAVIKIQQFNTSLQNKLLPNREFNYGRLQHPNKWTDGLAKLYVYDPLPVHLLTGTTSLTEQSTWRDSIVFRTGPLEKQFFPLSIPAFGSDEIGTYVSFYYNSAAIASIFPSLDDVYNVKFFIFDFEDNGVIGDAFENSTDGSEFDIENRRVVDQSLLLSQHIYNGEPVPVVNPSLAVAYNYSDAKENSHFVYLAYQALEDSKWNIYVRQIRLSEYKRQDQIEKALSEGNVSSLNSLDIGSVIYRITCISDSCSEFDDLFTLKRTIVFEVLTSDGREVLNPGLSGNWPSLCQGHPASEFPREKVFVQFIHSTTADRCPDSAGFNSIFFNWNIGQEFIVPASSLTAQGLFSIIQLPSDTSIPLGNFAPALSIGGAILTSSAVSAVWYNGPDQSNWSVISGQSFGTLQLFKGLDVAEPILITSNNSGHSTRPVIKTSYNNDIYVTYESVESGLPQVKICGTRHPSSSLPVGVFRPRNPDSTLRYFLGSNDFVYENIITLSTDAINQMPDVFVDFNDVVHVTWQSNRDKRWEIYYANSEDDFRPVRITNHEGKSFHPSIDGDNTGRVFITWHDNRFNNNNYEIMLAYYPGNRILPLLQQDPYLASIRNGYQHFDDQIELNISNNSDSVLCFSNFIVDFYIDRHLTQLAFSVRQEDYPFAFNIPGSQNDSFTKTYTDFATGWIENPYDLTLEGLEFDTGLAGSSLTQFVVDFSDSGVDSETGIEISFRGSNNANDSTGDLQWSEWISVSTSGIFYLATFGLTNISGRYKQVRFRFNGNEPEINMLQIVSESAHRVCLSPEQNVVGILDMTPNIRIDHEGNETAEFPLPVAMNSNQTYFVKVRAIKDNGVTINMPNQLSSFSCDSCVNNPSPWGFESCSIKTTVTNSEAESSFYNFRISIYQNSNKTRRIGEFLLFNDSRHLSFVEVDGTDAKNIWQEYGLLIEPNNSKTIVFWPELSASTGLICGINYYIDIEYCLRPEILHEGCEDFAILETMTWRCNCQSRRWNQEIETSPVNILDINRWISSGSGLSDTRLTETIGCNNLNPVIKMRSNQTGLVLFQTNRPETGETQDENRYRIYASLFNIVPNSEMFASATQSIVSPFGSVYHKSDVPICGSSNSNTIGCFDANKQRINPTLIGENISFGLDQYDNIFLAVETPFSGELEQCNEFTRDKQKYITVHTCGATIENLSGTESQIPGDQCFSPEILGKSFVQSSTESRKTQLQIRVLKKHVIYHITKNKIPMPVVSKCDIELEIIGAIETMAIRLKNGGDKQFSPWLPLNPKVAQDTTILDWKLSAGSGIKTIEFQCATPAGLSQTGLINIVSDYAKITYSVKFYHSLSATPFPPTTPDLRATEIWLTTNELPLFDGKSVASLRKPLALNESIIVPISDYIFVEIIPDAQYMELFLDIDDTVKSGGNSGIEPTFDFLQQGQQDSYGLPTIWARNGQGNEVFRGFITLNKDKTNGFIDGLANIIPHFKNDCSDAMTTGAGNADGDYTRDDFNVIVQGDRQTMVSVFPEQDDFWGNERDLNGLISHKIFIRPDEDPYFIFGEPNYRAENND